MKTTIDRAGRVVIPKEVRQKAGLKSGDSIDVAVQEGNVIIRHTETAMRLEKKGPFTVIVPEIPIEDIEEDIVEKTISQLREERIDNGKGI